jgi:hypothetical protein
LGYSRLVFIDKNLNKIEEINLKTYSQLKRIKKIDNSFYLMGSGFLAKLEEKNIVNLNLPKNYLEVNDITKKENVYFLASNSGGFYYTTNFIDYQVIKLDTFDNINKIVDFGDIYLICSNSTVFKIKY